MSNPHPTLSPRGNRCVRRVLWMISIAVVRWIPENRTSFQQRIVVGKSKMKTLVAVGRKLLVQLGKKRQAVKAVDKIEER